MAASCSLKLKAPTFFQEEIAEELGYRHHHGINSGEMAAKPQSCGKVRLGAVALGCAAGVTCGPLTRLSVVVVPSDLLWLMNPFCSWLKGYF